MLSQPSKIKERKQLGRHGTFTLRSLKFFCKLRKDPPTIEDDDMKVLERFVILMYDRSSTVDSVNEARLGLFARKLRPYEAIPPARAALLQHQTFSISGRLRMGSGNAAPARSRESS